MAEKPPWQQTCVTVGCVSTRLALPAQVRSLSDVFSSVTRRTLQHPCSQHPTHLLHGCVSPPVCRCPSGRLFSGCVLLNRFPSCNGCMTIFRSGQQQPGIGSIDAYHDELCGVFSVPTAPY